MVFIIFNDLQPLLYESLGASLTLCRQATLCDRCHPKWRIINQLQGEYDDQIRYLHCHTPCRKSLTSVRSSPLFQFQFKVLQFI